MLFLTADKIAWVHFADEPPAFGRKKRIRGRKACGVRYEKRAHEHFQSQFHERYVVNPWIKYLLVGESRCRFAQPDALLFDMDAGVITVCEMKYQHTSDSYWQVVGKYIPLLEKMFPKKLWDIRVVEIVKWYDCNVQFPVGVKLRERIDAVKENEFAVHIFKPTTSDRQAAQA